MAATKEKLPEVVPLSDDWGNFDLEGASLEELEQRFELSLLTLPPAMDHRAGFCEVNCDNCGALACCSN